MLSTMLTQSALGQAILAATTNEDVEATFDQAKEATTDAVNQAHSWLSSNTHLLIGGGIALLALIIFFAVAKNVLGGKKKKLSTGAPKPEGFTLSMLGNHGVPTSGPSLTFRDVPVRLAAVVIAPVGRSEALPSADRLPQMIDLVVPGLAKVIASHRPLARSWPAQVSVRGFAGSFFKVASLPGEAMVGKQTPWTAVAGDFQHLGSRYAIGLVLRADRDNNLGQIVVEESAQWLGYLKIQEG